MPRFLSTLNSMVPPTKKRAPNRWYGVNITGLYLLSSGIVQKIDNSSAGSADKSREAEKMRRNQGKIAAGSVTCQTLTGRSGFWLCFRVSISGAARKQNARRKGLERMIRLRPAGYAVTRGAGGEGKPSQEVFTLLRKNNHRFNGVRGSRRRRRSSVRG